MSGLTLPVAVTRGRHWNRLRITPSGDRCWQS